MDRRVTAAWVSIASALAAYLIIGTLLTGIVPPIGVLVLVLVLWFSVYRFRHKGLGNQELIRKMRADLEGTLEGIKERMAQQEARRLATLEHEEQARLERERKRAERERRRASDPTRDPAVSEYAELIESRVRERERSGQESERQ